MSLHQIVLVALALLFLFTLPVTRRFWNRMGLAGAAALLIAVAGCSSGASSTPAGTYTVTITGTSAGVSHTVAVNVTVN
jgi:hypothetical protein